MKPGNLHLQGANSSKMFIILEDKVLNTYIAPFQTGKGVFFFERRRIYLKSTEWEEILEYLQQMIGSVKYGHITLVLQDGKVVQIEKNEKVRLQSNKSR